MTKLFWSLVARIVTKPAVMRWLLHRALRTPYTHIMSQDGQDAYMLRYWLFNPYPASGQAKRWAMLPSMRLHFIRRADQDRHLHDHPWNARTIILRGWYLEERVDGSTHKRAEGYTGRLRFGEYHRIHEIHPDGVITLFITWRNRGEWGFLVDGQKVPWKRYLGGQEGMQ